MVDYLQAIDASSAGMTFQKLRMEVISMNIANMNSSRAINGRVYQPLEVVSTPSSDLNHSASSALEKSIVGEVIVVEQRVDPRRVFDPSHPDADEDGFVNYPNVDHAKSMVDLLSATRAYEANVKVISAAKAMALRALEIGE